MDNTVLKQISQILFNCEKYSDIKFVFSESKVVYGHSTILKIKCPALYDDLILGNIVSNPITVNIRDNKYSAFYEFMRFLYTGQCDVNPLNLETLWKFSIKYNSPDIVPVIQQQQFEMENNVSFDLIKSLKSEIFQMTEEKSFLEILKTKKVESSNKKYQSAKYADEFRRYAIKKLKDLINELTTNNIETKLLEDLFSGPVSSLQHFAAEKLNYEDCFQIPQQYSRKTGMIPIVYTVFKVNKPISLAGLLLYQSTSEDIQISVSLLDEAGFLLYQFGKSWAPKYYCHYYQILIDFVLQPKVKYMLKFVYHHQHEITYHCNDRTNVPETVKSDCGTQIQIEFDIINPMLNRLYFK